MRSRKVISPSQKAGVTACACSSLDMPACLHCARKLSSRGGQVFRHASGQKHAGRTLGGQMCARVAKGCRRRAGALPASGKKATGWGTVTLVRGS